MQNLNQTLVASIINEKMTKISNILNILNVVSNYQHVLGDIDDVGKVRASMLVPVGQVVATFDLKLARFEISISKEILGEW